MKCDHVVVQSPSLPATQLFLLFHAAGDNPVAMIQSLPTHFPGRRWSVLEGLGKALMHPAASGLPATVTR